MKEPIKTEFSEMKQVFPDIEEDEAARPRNRMVFEDHRTETETMANPEEHPGEDQPDESAEEFIPNIPQRSPNILEHIYLLNAEREQLEEQIKKIEEDVNYLYHVAYDQGARKVGNYKLERRENTRRILNVEKFRAAYPDIFDRYKSVTATAMEKEIGKEKFQQEMQEKYPTEFDAAAKVTIADIKDELPKPQIDEVCDAKITVKYKITRNDS